MIHLSKKTRYPTCSVYGFLALIAAQMLGCGAATDAPEYAPVSGVVHHNGKEVPGALVEFVSATSPARSAGTTDASGQFTISSNAPGDGAPVGSHQVTVKKMELPGVTDRDTEGDATVPRKRGDPSSRLVAVREAAKKGIKERNLLPEKYANPATSGLTFEVKSGEDNQFLIDLVD